MSPSGNLAESDAFFRERDRQIDQIFRSNPGLSDHRARFPWLTNRLGDPFSGIWFIAENPSLGQVERVRNPDGGPPTVGPMHPARVADYHRDMAKIRRQFEELCAGGPLTRLAK
jgi:hypothetical protein